MELVVVESPSKAKTIGKYLGKGYVVKASKGHVVDLPKSGLAIDVEHDFKPEYVVTNPKSLNEIKKSLKDADKLISFLFSIFFIWSNDVPTIAPQVAIAKT